MNKVVKCKNKKCEQYFMHTEKNTKCPFCYTEYGLLPASAGGAQAGEVEKENKNPSAPASPELKQGEQAEKKVATKTKKDSFKMWGKS